MPIADGVVRDAPADGVGVGQPAEERRQLPISVRMDHEMPVVAHDAVAENADGMPLLGLGNEILESQKILVGTEHFHASGGAVENVVDEAACVSGHGRVS